jgi:hypothetical protein
MGCNLGGTMGGTVRASIHCNLGAKGGGHDSTPA